MKNWWFRKWELNIIIFFVINLFLLLIIFSAFLVSNEPPWLIPFPEVRRRKWLEDNPESSSNDDPVVFDTSIIPWWAWIKRFHLPEAELLNGLFASLLKF